MNNCEENPLRMQASALAAGLCLAFAAEVTRGLVVVSNLDDPVSQTLPLYGSMGVGKGAIPYSLDVAAISFTTGSQTSLISKIMLAAVGSQTGPDLYVCSDAGGVPGSMLYWFHANYSVQDGTTSYYYISTLGTFTPSPSTTYWLYFSRVSEPSGNYATLSVTNQSPSVTVDGWTLGNEVMERDLNFTATYHPPTNGIFGPQPGGFSYAYVGQTPWANALAGSVRLSIEATPVAGIPEPGSSITAAASAAALVATRARRRCRTSTRLA